MTDHRLEPEAQRIADATSQPPYFYQMTPTAARAGPRRPPGPTDGQTGRRRDLDRPSRPRSAT